MNIEVLQQNIDKIIIAENSVDNKLQEICNTLKNSISYYNWVGFYFNHETKKELKLAQYAGEETFW